MLERRPSAGLIQGRSGRAALLRRAGSGVVVGALLAALLPLLAVLAAPAAQAAYKTPKTPRFTLPAEPGVPYEPQTTCDPKAKPGVVAFMKLILATYPNTGSSGIGRACSVGGKSEHKEGRAWDWRVRAWNARESGQATAMIGWLSRNEADNARRLGVMYVVWNDKIWSPGRRDQGWRPYVNAACKNIPLAKCSPTLRHRDHVHISFSRAGAAKQTSFWGKKPPAGSTVTPPKSTPQPTPLAAYRSTVLRRGASGPAVVALEKAMRMTAIDGSFGPQTEGRVVGYQQAKGLPVTGVVDARTWAALDATIGWHAERIVAVDHLKLRPGVRSAAVKTLEKALWLPADDVYDARTVEHVVAFQRAHGIAQTGLVEAKTWRALRGL